MLNVLCKYPHAYCCGNVYIVYLLTFCIYKVRITVHVPSMNEVVYHFWERNASAFAKIVNIGSKEVNI